MPKITDDSKSCMGTAEVTKRFFCTLSCIVVLIASAITLSIIYQIERTVQERNVIYEDVDSYKVAVWYLVCLGSVGMIYHILMICFYMITNIKKHYNIYVLMNAMICVLFALCLFAGGVVNALYSAEDHQLSPDICTFGTINDEDENICTKILQIRILQGVSAGLSFLSSLSFGSLVKSMLGNYQKNNQVHISHDENVPSAQDTPLHPPNPPPYTSISPPPYESTIALL